MANRVVLLGLYRQILRLHQQHLPRDMKEIGDQYVRSEFKAMKKANKLEHVEVFQEQWKKYMQQLQSQEKVIGKTLSLDSRKKLNAEQKESLRKLKKVTINSK
eukprot:TRINITY_DN11317_c0_g1_i1.p1 TRINITY_DN11317_c0_g1~~TRINITY_DN11317_c0_g1_i1.p1  ORF type:complete len:103 (-),score=28.13 TRINITY_DN11317_c0_g1_i1:190-498(-)